MNTIVPGGAAETAGVRPKDLLVMAGGQPVLAANNEISAAVAVLQKLPNCFALQVKRYA